MLIQIHARVLRRNALILICKRVGNTCASMFHEGNGVRLSMMLATKRAETKHGHSNPRVIRDGCKLCLALSRVRRINSQTRKTHDSPCSQPTGPQPVSFTHLTRMHIFIRRSTCLRMRCSGVVECVCRMYHITLWPLCHLKRVQLQVPTRELMHVFTCVSLLLRLIEYTTDSRCAHAR